MYPTQTTRLTLALSTVSALFLAVLPAQAQTTSPFTGDFTGMQTYFHQITPTSEEDRDSYTSTNSSFGVTSGVDDIFLSYDPSGDASLTPNTVSTFNFTSASGSLFGVYVSDNTIFSGQTATISSELRATGGTGSFQGAIGDFFATRASTSSTAHVAGTITFPAAVPEASTTVSFGVLLALGLGGMVIAAKRRKALASGS